MINSSRTILRRLPFLYKSDLLNPLFTRSITDKSSALSKLSSSQSLLICKNEDFDYFNQYCKEHVPPQLIPLVVPLSQASQCKYADAEIQNYFMPLYDFYLSARKSNVLYDCSQNLLFSPKTTSTQVILEQHYTKAQRNVIYFAKDMTEGRGRGDNKWESHKGALMFSFTTKGINVDSIYLPYVDSLCITKAIKPYIPEITIKWPNDVYIKGKKVIGILCNTIHVTVPDAYSVVHGIVLM